MGPILLFIVRDDVLISNKESARRDDGENVECPPSSLICTLVPGYATMCRDPLECYFLDALLVKSVERFPN